ncbi:MAG TPA: hypothetical protein VGP68_08500 [Gemmataceae bacterium]|nr:hypothetical protein [Gemmataceae bacterium]
MEGISPIFFWGILFWYLAVLVFTITSLVALGLLLARRTRAARIVFATGLLCPAVSTLPVFLGWLEPAADDSHSGDSMPMVLLVLAELSILLAGAGQFIASLRSGLAYAMALGCALGATGFVAAAGLCESDVGYRILGGKLATTLVRLKLPLEIVGLFLAVASSMVAILFPTGAQQTIQRLQE